MSFIFHSNFDSFSQREPKVQKMDSFYTGLLEWDFIKIINVTIGRVLFSDPIAFVDVIFRRTYSNLMLFGFT